MNINTISAVLLAALTVLWLGTVLVSLRRRRGSIRAWLGDYAAAISPILLGVILVALIMTLMNGTEAAPDEPELKTALIYQLKSGDNVAAVEAIEMFRDYGWLRDGSLQSVDLTGSNLQGVDLQGADLQGAILSWVILERANLNFTNLRGVHLGEASLHAANLQYANLQSTHLDHTNMMGANLMEADLQNAVMPIFNDRPSTSFDENTILPDGTRWTPETDMTRFTDPAHPDFWRSDDVESPAYGGES